MLTFVQYEIEREKDRERQDPSGGRKRENKKRRNVDRERLSKKSGRRKGGRHFGANLTGIEVIKFHIGSTFSAGLLGVARGGHSRPHSNSRRRFLAAVAAPSTSLT